MNTPDSIIRTKLHPPFIRQTLVSRPRLDESIAQGLRGPLTLITAPAGFGKTTLISAYLASGGMCVAWLSLDTDDNQVERFLTYLVAALQQAVSTIGVEAARLLASPNPPAPEAVLTTLINDLDGAGEKIALVLDDYHTISSQAVHEAATFLLDHCPMNFHLVIASRSDLPLPLARMRARGQAVELRAADLRFSETEAAEFLNDVMGLNLGAGLVAALDERTEGWIAGLQMAALSMRSREDVNAFIDGFSGTNRYILDYLMEEVLAGQAPDIQRFLINTSILRRLSAPLCDALLPDGEAASQGLETPSNGGSAVILEYLEELNLFLIPLDDERIWYRYHHLFADMLQARLQQAPPDLVLGLHVRASGWLEHDGQVNEAIRHLITAGEIDQAADLIEHHGPVRFAEDDPSVLHMADHLPREVILARPRIGLNQAWLFIIQGRIGKAVPLLNDLAEQLGGADPGTGEGWMRTVISCALAFLNPLEGTPGYVPLPEYSRLDEIPAQDHILRDAADILYGMTLGRRGDLDKAAEVSEKGIERWRTIQRTQTIPTLVPFLTRIYLMQGRLYACAALCRQYLDSIQARDLRFIYSAGSMKIDLGEVLYEWNCLEEAEGHIREGLQANESWRNIMTEGFGLVVLARLKMAEGDFDGAMATVEKFETRLRQQSMPREFYEDLHTLRVRVQLAGGDLDKPSNWAAQVQRSDDCKLYPEHYRLTLARIRLAQGRYAEVEELLAGFVPPDAAGSRISRQLEASLMLAAAFAGQGRLREAMERVESALILAEPEGYIRAFLDAGEPVRELLETYLQSDTPERAEYARTALEVFPPVREESSTRQQPGGVIEPLSERELEVLALMAEGKTNKEIAGELIIAAGTVKAHTASIYRKLDVANRTEAAAKARELRILD